VVVYPAGLPGVARRAPWCWRGAVVVWSGDGCAGGVVVVVWCRARRGGVALAVVVSRSPPTGCGCAVGGRGPPGSTPDAHAGVLWAGAAR
jgi:hypothetical protein